MTEANWRGDDLFWNIAAASEVHSCFSLFLKFDSQWCVSSCTWQHPKASKFKQRATMRFAVFQHVGCVKSSWVWAAVLSTARFQWPQQLHMTRSMEQKARLFVQELRNKTSRLVCLSWGTIGKWGWHLLNGWKVTGVLLEPLPVGAVAPSV